MTGVGSTEPAPGVGLPEPAEERRRRLSRRRSGSERGTPALPAWERK